MVQRGLILEITPQTALCDYRIKDQPFVERVGLIVSDETDPVDCRGVMRGLAVPVCGIAFITDVQLRYVRRMSVEVSLSLDHGCPCRVFNDSAQARVWLEQRMAL